MIDKTNRHDSTYGEEWGSMDEGIFGSWVKYGGNMEEVEKRVRAWGEVRESVGRCVKGVESVLGYGEVWGMGSRCVEVCLRCGKGVRVRAKGVGLGLGKGRWGYGEVWEEWGNPG